MLTGTVNLTGSWRCLFLFICVAIRNKLYKWSKLIILVLILEIQCLRASFKLPHRSSHQYMLVANYRSALIIYTCNPYRLWDSKIEVRSFQVTTVNYRRLKVAQQVPE